MEHDHRCSCGSNPTTPHPVGEGGCQRRLTEAPVKVANDADMWIAEGSTITDYTLREQRGYSQFPCGCWSRWPGSKNSLDFN